MGRDERIDAAVAKGIISAEQAAAIRALDASVRAPTRFAVPAINAPMVAYILGAIIVVVAMIWFLGDRWGWLGPRGVIAVCVLYAGVFLMSARVLLREGFPVARGFAVLLAIAMVPPIVTSSNGVFQWFDPVARYHCYWPDFVFWSCRGEEFVMELATAAATLFALRRIRFSLLVLPLAAIALRLLFHVADTWSRNGLGDSTSGWVWVAGGSALAAVAYAVDRHQAGDEDFARWLHFAAVACAIPASMMILDQNAEYRHVMVPGAFVAFAAALLLQRVAWLLLGMGWFVTYVVWLASDVFEDSPAFPILLAALGIAVIIATVWVQRNAAMLVRRFGTVTSDGRPRFPGGVPLLLAPALVALIVLPVSFRDDAERRDIDQWRSRRYQHEAARQRLRERAEQEKRDAARDSTTAGGRPIRPPEETGTPSRP